MPCPIVLEQKLAQIPIVIGALFVFGVISKPIYNAIVDHKSIIQKSLKEAVDFALRDLIITLAS